MTRVQSIDIEENKHELALVTSEKNEDGLHIGPIDDHLDHESLSDFQRFLFHQDFGLFILLATKVKIIRKNLVSGTIPNASDVITITHIQSRKGQKEVDEAAKLIQSKLFIGGGDDFNFTKIVLPRGTCKVTDDLMKESIISLAREFNRCMTWYNAFKGQSLTKSPPRKRVRLNIERREKKKSNEAIAVKYSKHQTDILTNWMIDHVVSILRLINNFILSFCVLTIYYYVLDSSLSNSIRN